MKITAVKPFIASTGNFFVKVETDEGIYGVGEGGIRRRALAMAEVIRSFESTLLGQDPFRIEYLWQQMFRGGFFPRWCDSVRSGECGGHCVVGY